MHAIWPRWVSFNLSLSVKRRCHEPVDVSCRVETETLWGTRSPLGARIHCLVSAKLLRCLSHITKTRWNGTSDRRDWDTEALSVSRSGFALFPVTVVAVLVHISARGGAFPQKTEKHAHRIGGKRLLVEMKRRAVMFEYKSGNKINHNSTPREARRIEICFLFLFQKTVQQGIWKKAISHSPHPKLTPFILLVWLCWAGLGEQCYRGLVVD